MPTTPATDRSEDRSTLYATHTIGASKTVQLMFGMDAGRVRGAATIWCGGDRPMEIDFRFGVPYQPVHYVGDSPGGPHLILISNFTARSAISRLEMSSSPSGSVRGIGGISPTTFIPEHSSS